MHNIVLGELTSVHKGRNFDFRRSRNQRDIRPTPGTRSSHATRSRSTETAVLYKRNTSSCAARRVSKVRPNSMQATQAPFARFHLQDWLRWSLVRTTTRQTTLRPTSTCSYSYCRDASGRPRPCTRASAKKEGGAATSTSTFFHVRHAPSSSRDEHLQLSPARPA